MADRSTDAPSNEATYALFLQFMAAQQDKNRGVQDPNTDGDQFVDAVDDSFRRQRTSEELVVPHAQVGLPNISLGSQSKGNPLEMDRVATSSTRSRQSVDPPAASIEALERNMLEQMSQAKNQLKQDRVWNASGSRDPDDSYATLPSQIDTSRPVFHDSIDEIPRESDNRPHRPTLPVYGPITMTVSGTPCTFRPVIEGFDHPYRRGWTGIDQSNGGSKFKYYAVKIGYDPGIYESQPGAWVRIADFQRNTRSSVFPSGVSPVWKGFQRYAEAVDFLGWDPDLVEDPHEITRYRPPPRLEPYARHFGPDPSKWCGMITAGGTDIPPATVMEDGLMSPADISSPTEDKSTSKSTSSTSGSTVTTHPSQAEANGHAFAALQKVTDKFLDHLQGQNTQDTRERHYSSLLSKAKASDFPELVKEPDSTALARWDLSMRSSLSNAHWKIDGSSILTMDDRGELTDAFELRTHTLCRVLVQLLVTHHDAILTSHSDLIDAGRGVSLYHAILDHLNPNSDSTALAKFRNFCNRIHKNGESVATLQRDLSAMHRRLNDNDIVLGERVLVLQLIRAVLDGAYGSHQAFRSYHDDILRGRMDLSAITYDEFGKEVLTTMSAADLYVNGTAVTLPPSAIARRMDGGSSSFADPWYGQSNLDPLSIDASFAKSKCPICCIPRGARNEHFLANCPEAKKRGVVMSYDATKDENRLRKKARLAQSDGDKGQGSDKRKDGDKGQDATKHTGTGKAAGTAMRVTTSNSFSPFVDAHNIKETDSLGYFHPLYDKLRAFRVVDRLGASRVCIGRCRVANGIHQSPEWHTKETVVPDSGATSDMFRLREHFSDDYQPCENGFVYMGDGSPTPVAGIGTARIKIQGKVIELPNALHIPGLNCNLMSITRHGLRGSGCSYLSAGGCIHLAFPGFTFSEAIPPNGDARLELEELTDRDADMLDFVGYCEIDSPLNTDHGRRMFLNRIHRGRIMTRSQTKQKIKNTKKMVEDLRTQGKRGVRNESRILEECELTEDQRSQTDQNDSRDTRNVPPPTQFVPDSATKAVVKYTRYELETFFGGRQLSDYKVLSDLGSGIHVLNNQNDVQTVGKLVNRRRGKRRRKASKAEYPLHVVGMDIGYGQGASPWGYKYVLVLTDQCTTYTWTYGMSGTSGKDIQEALWKFFVDAGGFPGTIQCDFDPRFIGGAAVALLRSHGCRIRAAPPGRQSQNGMVERRWQILENMARALLAEASLPTKFWYWAIREATIRLNILPITTNPKRRDDVQFMTTPFEAYHGQQPDYRILYPFGRLGSFRRTRDGTRHRQTFDSQGMMGIALGRSEYTNGMIFYNPTLDSFSTSADYVLDSTRSLSEVFPSIRYDGGLTTSVLSSNRTDTPNKFEVGEQVFVSDEETQDVCTGVVQTPPTSKSPWYTVQLESKALVNVSPNCIYSEFDVPSGGNPSNTLGFFTPEWLCQDSKITFLDDGTYKQGYLNLDADNFWELVTRGHDGKVTSQVSVPDLNYSWKSRLQENTLRLGWEEDTSSKLYGHGRHVSAGTLVSTLAPHNLRIGLAEKNPDSETWRAAYDEEYLGLTGMDTFESITEEEYQRLLSRYGDAAKAIPTMNLFTVKKDENGKPVRAKSRIVVLGNLEKRVWEKADTYAPVIAASANRLLVSMAVEDGRVLKQGDCKNAFCQPELPDDEITIAKPPKGCPQSAPGTYWRLKKTLYGLSRSPRHWYDTFSGHLTTMGFEAMPQDPCVFKATPIEGEPPIYVGMYVDDFIYYSKSDAVEQWFEACLGSKLRVDFMGAVSWFLGCSYEWHHTKDGRLVCHISQQAYVEHLLDKFEMTDCVPSRRLFQSGLPIDSINRSNVPTRDYAEFVKRYQSLMGGLTWLVTSTRPDINVATKLLSQYNSCPSIGHMKAAKNVLRYLKGTASNGIWFTQNDDRLAGNVGIPDAVDPNELIVTSDSCWGPQDASIPKPNDQRTVYLDEMNSLQGHYVTRMGGAILWGVLKEKRASGSSCEAEIKAMDNGVKDVQFMRHLTEQLGLRDSSDPIPVLNDNKGSVDWVNNGGVATKKLRHANIREARVAEAHTFGEVNVYWIPGKDNPADLYTKEHKDLAQFEKLRDLMVRPREWVHADCPVHQPSRCLPRDDDNTVIASNCNRAFEDDDVRVFVGSVPVGTRDWIMGGAKKPHIPNPNIVEEELGAEPHVANAWK